MNVSLGQVAVHSKRLLLIDPALIDHWTRDESLDGLYDVACWGRDAEMLSEALGWPLPHLAENVALEEARAIYGEAVRVRGENTWWAGVEIRAHSHFWQGDALAESQAKGGEILIGDLPAVVLSPGYGDQTQYEVTVEREEQFGLITRLTIEFIRD
ncbi:MAG: hypothetical protein HY260_16900 [Chloroflexi bacterium]|nr:hypothetical protein [Chloroflexota bacterium]